MLHKLKEEILSLEMYNPEFYFKILCISLLIQNIRLLIKKY